MIQFPKLKTHKLFYGKYPYKITTRIKDGHWFRHIKVDRIASLGFDPLTQKSMSRELIDYSKALLTIGNVEYKFRVERSTTSLFLKNKDDFEKTIKALEIYITSTTEPEDEYVLDTISSNKKFVVCKDLPYGKYTHKVIFKQMPPNIRASLFEWAKKYDEDKIYMSGNTESYLSGKKQWCWDPFIYVGDEKMLMMLGLSAQGYIRKTEEFIPRSSINTSP